MGSRANKVPLDRLTFDLTPKDAPDKYQISFRDEAMSFDDPELPYIQRLYEHCYLSVFNAKPFDDVTRFKNEVSLNAQKASCSLRMFFLANMVAHTLHEKSVVDHTEKARSAKFSAQLLTGKRSITRAATYQKMCHDRFGTFSLSSLAVVSGSDKKDMLPDIMLCSELTAARAYVRYKIFNGAPGELHVYEQEELQLAPEWLAIEQTYIDLVLFPREKGTLKRGSNQVEQHRANVRMTHGYYKRNPSSQRLAFLARQSIMKEAVKQVVSAFNHVPSDFLYPRQTITEPMAFWKELAQTIRHYHCWLYLNNEPSYFSPRRSRS